MPFKMNLETLMSRPQSVKAQVSNHSWNRGISNFFMEDIPFSWSTGKKFSKIIVRYIMLLLQNQKTETITHCYEIGAGVGQLSKYILENLSSRNKLNAIKFHGSDSSEKIVKELKNSSVFSNYKDYIQFKTMTFDALKFPKTAPPHFLILSYVLDVIPQHHLIWKEGEIKEEKVVSRLNGAPLLDTSSQPFQSIQSSDIPNWVENAEPTTVLNHLTRITQCIDEEIHSDTQHPLSKDEQGLLKGFFKEKEINNCRFNYSKSIITSFKTLFKHAPKTCLWLIQDVGDMTPEGTDKKLIFSYGVCQFYRIYFPLIQYIAEQFKFKVKCTSFPDGNTQHMIIYRGLPEDDINDVFSDTTQTPFTAEETKINQAVHDLAIQSEDKPTENSSVFYEKVTTMLQDMKDKDDLSYSFNLSIAKECYCKQLYSEALKHTEELIREYGDFAISAKLIQGQSYTALGDYKKAKDSLKQAIKVAPFMPELYLQLSIIFAKTKDYDSFLQQVIYYLRTVETIPIWNHIFTFIIVLTHYQKNEKDGNREKAKDYLEAMKTFIKAGHFNISDSISEKINTFNVNDICDH